MVAPVDIANRAASRAGARQTIADLTDSKNPIAVACALEYEPLRQRLLRTAPWGFARKTLVLTTLGLATDTPPAAPYPWLAKYLYPADCQKFRYVLPPPFASTPQTVAPNVSDTSLVPWCLPSRAFRYIRAYDDTVVPAREVILSNVLSATGVYTADVTDPDRWDSLFTDAMVNGLANEICVPISGNVSLKQGFVQIAEASILKARTADSNEAIPSSDIPVDWIDVRGVGGWTGGFGGVNVPGPYGALGFWNASYDSMNWSM
jgi:hypothetical protein